MTGGSQALWQRLTSRSAPTTSAVCNIAERSTLHAQLLSSSCPRCGTSWTTILSHGGKLAHVVTLKKSLAIASQYNTRSNPKPGHTTGENGASPGMAGRRSGGANRRRGRSEADWCAQKYRPFWPPTYAPSASVFDSSSEARTKEILCNLVVAPAECLQCLVDVLF